jgi:Flp pilus assembly pilin Flp
VNRGRNRGQQKDAAGRSRAPRLTVSPRMRDLARDDRGAATAEYAVATLAAVGFAGLLVVILRSDAVRQMLTDVVRTALTLPG